MKDIKGLIGENIKISSDRNNYTVSKISGDKVTLVDFQNRKVLNLRAIDIEEVEELDESTFAGFSEDWINGKEFDGII